MNSGRKRKAKFKTLLLFSTILLVLVIEVTFTGVTFSRMRSHTQTVEKETLRAYHSRLCDRFSDCMSDIDMLRSFILRKNMLSYSYTQLNLVDETTAAEVVSETDQSLLQLSVSGSVVRDFIIFASHSNQRNLYCSVKNRQRLEENFPSFDVLVKAGIDGVIHTNMNNMVKWSSRDFTNIKTNRLTKEELQAVRNMVDYFTDEYVVCGYLSSKLVVFRLDKAFMENTFSSEKDVRLFVCDNVNRPILSFGANKQYAAEVSEHLQKQEDYFEVGQNCYMLSTGVYGGTNLLTEFSQDMRLLPIGKHVRIYLLLAVLGIGLAMLISLLFSHPVFYKLRRIRHTISRQIHQSELDLIDGDFKPRRWRLTFSSRIWLTLLCSGISALLLTTIVTNAVLESESTKKIERLGGQLAENYADIYAHTYDRYSYMSSEKLSSLLDQLYQNHTEGTQLFENEFYYDATYLPGYWGLVLVDENLNVLYKTTSSNPIETSYARVSDILKRAQAIENFESTGAFVPLNAFLSNKKTLVYVRPIESHEGNKGTVMLFLEAPVTAAEYPDRSITWDFFVVDAGCQPLFNSDKRDAYDSSFIEKQRLFDDARKILYSVNDSTDAYIGKCVTLTYYDSFLNRIKNIQYLNFFWALLIALVCIPLTYLLCRRIVRPFDALIKSMKATPGDGYQKIDETFGFDEIDTVVVVYNEMISRLKQLVENSIRQETKQNELRTLQAQTEFKMLEQQINPHFLFNTLECVNMLAINGGRNDISAIVKSLSHILRYVISRNTIVCIGEEIKALESYVEIQKARFGDLFSVEFELDTTLFGVGMIKFILQPVLENAISHGMIHAKDGNGNILITLSCYGDGVEFRIADNGAGIPPEKLKELRESLISDTDEPVSSSGGIGLKNVYKRIALYYNGRGSFEIDSEPEKGTTVTIRLPFDIEL